MIENEINKPIYSYSKVLKVIDKLTEDEKSALLGLVKVDEIAHVLSNKGLAMDYSNRIAARVNEWILAANSIKKLIKLIEVE